MSTSPSWKSKCRSKIVMLLIYGWAAGHRISIDQMQFCVCKCPMCKCWTKDFIIFLLIPIIIISWKSNIPQNGSEIFFNWQNKHFVDICTKAFACRFFVAVDVQFMCKWLESCQYHSEKCDDAIRFMSNDQHKKGTRSNSKVLKWHKYLRHGRATARPAGKYLSIPKHIDKAHWFRENLIGSKKQVHMDVLRPKTDCANLDCTIVFP